MNKNIDAACIYPIRLRLNFIDLYKVEIEDRLNQNVNLWHQFKDIIEATTIEEYLFKHVDGGNEEAKLEVTQNFFLALKKSCKNELLYFRLLEFLDELDEELYQNLNTDAWESDVFSFPYQKLLMVLDKLLPIFDIEKVVCVLNQCSENAEDFYQKVIERWSKNEITKEYAKALIIRTYCIGSEESVYHLFYAIYKSNEKGKNFIEKQLFPDFEQYYLKNIFDDLYGTVYFVERDDNICNAIEDIMQNGKKSEYAKNLFSNKISLHQRKPLQYHITTDEPLQLRDYQLELAAKALEGENTLILSPTGSGKTIVAAYIIREHIYKLRNEGKNPRIAFIVPKVCLVDQQKHQFERFLSHCSKCTGIYGGCEDLDFNALIHTYDVIVSTAQLVVNATNPDYSKYDDNFENFSLDQFTMIILDEAHHADKNHSYNELMKEYFRCKYDRLAIEMPQIIGLTASLGIPGKNKSDEELMELIIEQCSNLHATSISRKTLEELPQNVGDAKETTITVASNDALVKEYYTYIAELVNAIEENLANIAGILIGAKIFESHPKKFESKEYKSWISIQRNFLRSSKQLSSSSNIQANKCFDYLDQLYEAHQCARLFPTKDTTEFYLDNEEFGKEDGTALERLAFRERQKLGEHPSSECDIFKNLIKVINEQFDKEPDSRIIIFVTRRYYGVLGSRIVERYIGKKCAYISSSNALSEEGGCSSERQSEILKDFKSGAIQILFATTIAEEGIDIVKCNLVIKYNYPTNYIGHVQTKGRTRQAESECISITFEEKIEEKEKRNKAKTGIINRVFEEFEKLSEKEKRQKFEKAIHETNCKRIEEETEKRKTKKNLVLKNGNYEILCGTCKTKIAESHELRLCREYFIPCIPNIWELVSFEQYSPKEIRIAKRWGGIGQLVCKNPKESCENNFAVAVYFKGAVLPSLTADKLTIVNIDDRDEQMAPESRTEILETLFYPNFISNDELQKMAQLINRPILEEC